MQWILQHTQGTDVLPPPPSFNPDPYTGAGAYVPGLAPTVSHQAGNQGSYSDPFTGAGAYVPPPTSGGHGGGGSALGSYSVTGVQAWGLSTRLGL